MGSNQYSPEPQAPSKDDETKQASIESIYERAVNASVPFVREESITLRGDDVKEQFGALDCSAARIIYKIKIEDNYDVSVSVDGHLWSPNATHHRYKAEYERPGPPTKSIPFKKYKFKTDVESSDDRSELGLNGCGPSSRDKMSENLEKTVQWDDICPAEQLRIIEAELIRNPEFARYRLQKANGWKCVSDILRYHTDAFKRSL